MDLVIKEMTDKINMEQSEELIETPVIINTILDIDEGELNTILDIDAKELNKIYGELKQPKCAKEPKVKKPIGRPRKHPIKVKSEIPGKRGRPKTLTDLYDTDGVFDRKNYYIKNKETIKARISKKVNCELCGTSIRYDHLTQHKRTNICKKKAL